MPTQVLVVVLVLAFSTAIGLYWQSRNGAYRSTGKAKAGAPDAALTAGEIGGQLGERVTFVQFSSEVCAPCRATARVLTGVAGTEHGVRHYELEATQHDDLVRRFSVLRTPTVLVLDHSGGVVGRMSGAVTPVQALDAIGRLQPTP